MSRTPGFGGQMIEKQKPERKLLKLGHSKEKPENQHSYNRAASSADASFSICAGYNFTQQKHTGPERRQRWQHHAARPQLLPSTHPSSNNTFIGDKSCCTTPAWPDAPAMSTVKETGQLQDSSCHADFLLFMPRGAIKLLLSSQQTLKQHSFHLSQVAPIKYGKLSEALVSHPLRLPPCTARTVLPPSFPSPPSAPPLDRIVQSSRMEWKTVWVSWPCTLQRANRRQLLVFQPKEQLKTCYIKGFIRVLKIHIFKGSWPLRAAVAQADFLPRSNTVPHTAAWPTTWTRGFKLSYMNWFTSGLRRVGNRAHTQLIHDWISILPANTVYGYHLIAINETNSSF